jgi:hypothetical protein
MEPISEQLGYLEKGTDRSKGTVGYQISQTDAAVKEAMNTAFKLVRKAIQDGVQTRIWAKRAMGSTSALLKVSLRISKTLSLDSSEPSDWEKIMWEFTGWENKILQTLRRYYGDTSNIIQQLKVMNPPLSSSHLKPFLEALQNDQRLTFTALESLTKNIEQFTSLRRNS